MKQMPHMLRHLDNKKKQGKLKRLKHSESSKKNKRDKEK